MKVVALCVLVLVSCQLSAQQDKIYLKNGSLLKGIVTNESIEDTILLDVGDASILVPLSTIDEIYPHRTHNRALKRINKTYDKKLSTAVGIGVVSGKSSDQDASHIRPSLHLTQTVHLHRLVNPGIRVEWVSFKDYNVFPLALSYQALFGRSHRSWMAYGNLGYGHATPLKDNSDELDMKGGLSYQLGVGWQLAHRNSSVQFSVGYLVQKLEEIQELNTDYRLIRKRTLNRVTAQVVYQFKYGK